MKLTVHTHPPPTQQFLLAAFTPPSSQNKKEKKNLERTLFLKSYFSSGQLSGNIS